MAQDGSVKEELQCTDCGEENAETSRTTVCPDFCKGGEDDVPTVDMKEEIDDHALGVPGIERFLEVECVEIKQEPVDDASSFVSPGEDLTGGHVSSPMPEMPVFHTVKVETLCPLKSELEEAGIVPEEMPDSDPDDPIVDEDSQTDPLALAPSHSKDGNHLVRGELTNKEKTPNPFPETTKHHNCKLCESVFDHSKDLRRHHLAVHRPDKNLRCDECGYLCRFKSDLKRHMYTHNSLMPFKCGECGRQFKRCNTLSQHLMCHTTERRFFCEMCDKKFKRKSDLKHHHMLVHVNVQEFICKECGREFKHSESLNRHVLTHSVERRFACDVCGKAFRRNYSLKEHMVIHTGLKEFQCKECGKEFKRCTILTRHMVTHSTERNSVCNVCEKRFKSKFDLVQHMATHSTLKLFKCKECGKEFKRRKYLTQHVKLHKKTVS